MNKTERDLTVLQALEKIKEAEIRARMIIEEAREKDVPQILERAAQKIKAVRDDILQRAKEQAQRRKQEIIAQAREEAEAIREETRAEVVKIDRRAEERFLEACRVVARKICLEQKGGSE